MAEDSVIILNVETGGAVRNIQDLKNNIKTYKEELAKLDIDSQEYKDTLNNLNINQNALKDAMHATTASMEDIASSAKGLNVVFDENNRLVNKGNQSYNALVHTMADLKQEWRATTDEIRREELREQISQVNNELKSLDAGVGNFSRSVGDYTNSVKKALGDFPSFADPAKKAIKGVNDTMSLMAGNPIMGVIAILTPLVMKITEALKEDEGSMEAINKVMVAMKPVMDFFQGVLGQIVGFLTDIISGIADFLGSNGFFNKIVEGVVGIGNAVVQFVIAPFKAVIDAIKIFKEQGLKGFRDVADTLWNDVKSGFSFKKNFETGQEIGKNMASGLLSAKTEVVDTAKEIATSVHDEVVKQATLTLQEVMKSLSIAEKRIEEEQKAYADMQKEIDAMVMADWDATNASIEQMFAEMDAMQENERRLAEKNAQDRINTMYAVADATSVILSSMADMYESNSKESEKQAKRIKAMRIASATIDTISGAVSALSSAQRDPGGVKGMIIGVANALAITTAGMAQVAKIRQTDPLGGGSAGSAVSAITSAPSTNMGVQSVRNVTSASEELRLNQMASDQRVVLVMSDLEVKQEQTRVQVAEASF